MPYLLYGAYDPAAGTRRTFLPWFCGIEADHETLEVKEGGLYGDLVKAHRDLMPNYNDLI